MYFSKKKRIPSSAGFTVIEMLVSIAVFFTVVVLAMTSLLAVMDASQKARAFNTVMSNMSVVLDRMAREVRLGRSYYCGISGGVNNTRNCLYGSVPATSFSFTNKDGERVLYSGPANANDTSMYRRVFGYQNEILNGSTVEIESFRVYVEGSGSGASDSKQPLVTFVIRGQAKSNKTSTRAPFEIQTTVTPRQFDR